MARIRTIKPDFWTDEKVVELDFAARLFFIGSWNYADDNGNLQRSAKKLKMQIFPADAIDCEPLIQSLISNGLLSEYSVNGEKYLHINNFRKHQLVNRPSKSCLPTLESASTQIALTEDSLTEGKGREGKGKGKPLSDGVNSSTEVGATTDVSPPLGFGNAEESITPAEQASPTRAGAMAVLLRQWERTRGKVTRITSQHPELVAWSEKGVTDEQLHEAYELAVIDREMAGDLSAINAGFLAVFVEKIINPPPAREKPDRWRGSNDGIERKGREIGLLARAGESYRQYADRIEAAIRSKSSEQGEHVV